MLRLKKWENTFKLYVAFKKRYKIILLALFFPKICFKRPIWMINFKAHLMEKKFFHMTSFYCPK